MKSRSRVFFRILIWWCKFSEDRLLLFPQESAGTITSNNIPYTYTHRTFRPFAHIHIKFDLDPPPSLTSFFSVSLTNKYLDRMAFFFKKLIELIFKFYLSPLNQEPSLQHFSSLDCWALKLELTTIR